jgi:large subunit ribosomal protein L23
MSKHPYQILIGPLLTEKATNGQGDAEPKYSFKVAVDANKIEIRKAVERAFNVRVEAVNTVLNKGKRKRLRTSKLGRRPDWKKAVVTLRAGDSINLI